MSEILSTYFAWAGPNMMPALAAASGAVWLTAWQRGHGVKPSNPAAYAIPVGAACVAIMVISVFAALVGLPPLSPGGGLGFVAGAVAGVMLAPRRASIDKTPPPAS